MHEPGVLCRVVRKVSEIAEQNHITAIKHIALEVGTEYAKMRNPEIEIICISAKTGEGIPELAKWMLETVKNWNN